MEVSNTMPKYSRLKEYLKEKMKRGAVAPGGQLPSENMLAEEFKISRHTVRQALNDLENEGLIFREQGRGTFRSYPTRVKGKTVALVTTYISEYIFPEVIRGIEEVLSAAGCTLILASTGNDQNKEGACLESLLQQKISGLIIEPTQSAWENINLKYYKDLEKRGIPYLMLHAYYPELEPAFIIMDDEKGGYMAAEYLVQLGHKEIAGIFKSDDLQGVKRRDGFMKALHKYGIKITSDLLGSYETAELYSYPYQFGRALCTKDDRPTAIVCYNDQIALMVLEALRDEGVKVPEDFSIMSFDDSSLAVASEVKMSTIKHPKAAMGRQAARFILDMIEDKVIKPRQVYQPELILRSSCRARRE